MKICCCNTAAKSNCFDFAALLQQQKYAVSIWTVAVYYTLKYYMHGSLFFSKKTAVHCILAYYMHGSLFYYKNTALWYILECYMHGSLFFSKKNCRTLYFGMLYAQ